MSKQLFEKFDVNSIPLEGRNLVEASAGTGKTFSIGILVLRLILEKDINIEKILLVTFTNNAVAELEERIRLFVREAHDHAIDGKAVKPYISEIVNQAAQLKGEESVKQNLKDALLFLDQLSVMTIHGFCGQCLSSQAFETGQLFGSELKSTMDDVFEHYVNDFWRSHINTLPIDIFKALKENSFEPAQILAVIKKHFAGKRFFLYNPGERYQLTTADFEAEYTRLCDCHKQSRQAFDDFVTNNKQLLLAMMQANTHAKKYVHNLESAEMMWTYLTDCRKNKRKYVEKVFADTLIGIMDDCEEKKKELDEHICNLLYNIYCFAIQEISGKVISHMNASGLLSYDELIKNLHTALTGPNQSAIVRELQSQYDAVFIDEFQDTDKLQYEIFKTAFHKDTILFYIGDPKQSIYAFRQADINTYFAAYKDVDKRYSMNTNFRSGKRLIDAMNQFFLPTEDFDTFFFAGEENAIQYVNVEANPDDMKGELYYAEKLQTPLRIEKHTKNENVCTSTANTILKLLTDENYQVRTGNQSRRIKPSDIGILVRSTKFGKEIKKLLNRKNIPAVILNDDRIMKSEEATSLFYVLRAMHNPTLENIYTGLLNNFTGKKSSEIKQLKKEQLIELFRDYKAKWELSGINLAISTYVQDFGVSEYLRDPDTLNGLRIISNLDQLKELLIKTEYHQRLNQAELLDWMKRAKDLELLAEDEGVIRLENDADSVTIITIHKAKGLQYNIVIAPQMDLTVYKSKGMLDLYDQGQYILIPNDQLTEQQEENYQRQSEQENRRLMYVALTRGVYACFIFKNTHSKFQLSGLTKILSVIGESKLIGITEFEDDVEDVKLKYAPEEVRNARSADLQNGFELHDPNWRFMSYSGLTLKTDIPFSPVETTRGINNEYDEFVFERLRKGSITGNMLHEIFEKIDFENSEKHAYWIHKSVRRFAASNTENYENNLPGLLENVLSAKIDTGKKLFRLNQISQDKRLHEMEFDFSVKSFDASSLMELCRQAGIDLSVINRTELYGIMNGFVDLFFEYDGKYYILDWKSNYLGNSISQYTSEGLEAAMTHNNYHLQYLIYTVAITKYLRQRLADFNYEKHFGGVIYAFVRGMRKDENTGVFFKRPGEKLIRELEDVLSDVVPI